MPGPLATMAAASAIPAATDMVVQNSGTIAKGGIGFTIIIFIMIICTIWSSLSSLSSSSLYVSNYFKDDD